MFLGCFLEIFGTFWVVTHFKDSDGPGEGGPSQENEFAQLRSGPQNWLVFSPFFEGGVLVCSTMSINTVLLPWVFPKKTRGCSFSPCVGGFAGGWPSPTEGLAAWARTATSAALSRTAGASNAGSCTQHAGRSSSEVHGDQRKKMKVDGSTGRSINDFSDWCKILMPCRKFETW